MESIVLRALTWIGDKVLGAVLGRPRVRLSIRTEDHPIDMSLADGPRGRDVVIRAVNVGQKILWIEELSIELDDGTEIRVGSKRSVEVLAPGYLERRESRQSLVGDVGTHRVVQLVAVLVDATRHRARLPREWQTASTWPR